MRAAFARYNIRAARAAELFCARRRSLGRARARGAL